MKRNTITSHDYYMHEKYQCVLDLFRTHENPLFCNETGPHDERTGGVCC